MEVFFIRHRKLLLFGSFVTFLYSFYEMYNGIILVISSHKGEGIGTLVDACISLFVSIYLFINVRKANRTFREENSLETNTDNNPES